MVGWWWEREEGSGVDWSRRWGSRDSGDGEGCKEVMEQCMGFVFFLGSQKGGVGVEIFFFLGV